MSTEIEIKDFKNEEHLLRSCTGRLSDRRLVILIIQSIITIGILILCLYKLSSEDLSCEQSSVYIGLLSTIIGIWIGNNRKL